MRKVFNMLTVEQNAEGLKIIFGENKYCSVKQSSLCHFILEIYRRRNFILTKYNNKKDTGFIKNDRKDETISLKCCIKIYVILFSGT